MAKHKTKTCPSCKRARPIFVVKKKKCDICRVESERKQRAESPKKLSWRDVKAKCRKELQKTDWALSTDVVEDGEITKAQQKKFRLYRRKIRDIKNGPEKDPETIKWPSRP